MRGTGHTRGLKILLYRHKSTFYFIFNWYHFLYINDLILITKALESQFHKIYIREFKGVIALFIKYLKYKCVVYI